MEEIKLDINNLTNVNKVTQEQENTDNYYVTLDGNDSSAIFDKLMKTATLHLDAQFMSGRIRQENYAQVFFQIYQATLNGAISLFLQKDLISKQIEKEEKSIELLERQKKGFDEDYIVKATEAIYQFYLSFLSTLPTVSNQPYPSVATGQYHLNFMDENAYTTVKDENQSESIVVDKQAPIKLKALDGITGLLINRLSEYQGIEPPINLDEVNTPSTK